MKTVSKEEAGIRLEAVSKPMPTFSNDSHRRLNSSYHHTLRKLYGGKSFMWKGPTPIVTVGDPGWMKPNDFRKLEMAPIPKRILFHRNILNPAFRMERIKALFLLLVATTTGATALECAHTRCGVSPVQSKDPEPSAPVPLVILVVVLFVLALIGITSGLSYYFGRIWRRIKVALRGRVRISPG